MHRPGALSSQDMQSCSLQGTHSPATQLWQVSQVVTQTPASQVVQVAGPHASHWSFAGLQAWHSPVHSTGSQIAKPPDLNPQVVQGGQAGVQTPSMQTSHGSQAKTQAPAPSQTEQAPQSSTHCPSTQVWQASQRILKQCPETGLHLKHGSEQASVSSTHCPSTQVRQLSQAIATQWPDTGLHGRHGSVHFG
jgi:hypothetical protein